MTEVIFIGEIYLVGVALLLCYFKFAPESLRSALLIGIAVGCGSALVLAFVLILFGMVPQESNNYVLHGEIAFLLVLISVALERLFKERVK